MAEIIKVGLIGDKDLVDYLLRDNINNLDVIIRTLKVKKE